MTLPFLNLSSSRPYEIPNRWNRISFLSFENDPCNTLWASVVDSGGSDSWTRDQNVVLYKLLMWADYQTQPGCVSTNVETKVRECE